MCVLKTRVDIVRMCGCLCKEGIWVGDKEEVEKKKEVTIKQKKKKGRKKVKSLKIYKIKEWRDEKKA